MKELIKVTTNEQGQQLVSARELHQGLEIKTPFHKWMPRMIEYGFVENLDYTVEDIFVHNSKGGKQTQVDYITTLDMAKEISMIQRSELGKKFRQYFIECERQLRENNTPQLSERDKIAIALMNGGVDAIEGAKRLVELETKPLLEKIEEDKPLVAFADRVIKKGDNILIRELSKIICDEGYKIGERKLYTKLREWGYIFKASTEPTQYAINRGYFVVITRMINTPYGERETFTTKVTPKGQVHIVEKIVRENKFK